MQVVELANMSNANGDKVDPSKLYIIGFWSYGGCSIEIEKVYVTNSDDYVETGIEDNVRLQNDENEIVDVYSITGVLLRKAIRRKDAIVGLPFGIYIVGGEKIMKAYRN